MPLRTEQIGGSLPQSQRATRVGTAIHGTHGLGVPGPEAPRLRLFAGAVLPGTRYQIVRWLGEGGMGVVYEAEHCDIERKVALKILRFDLSRQPRMVKVFRDEARAASRLGSPFIVEIYDFGGLPDGRLFTTMELVEGKDLVPEHEQSFDAASVIAILRQVCKGLDIAHRAGVVHRDVKPENILTTRTRNGREGVKLVDFGISAMLAAGPDEWGNNIAGTPHYMAPEQILGQAFDGRLDMYALGCTAYELLTGTTPFDCDRVEELLHRQLSEAPIPLRERRPDLDIPPALEAVVLRCLAKRPEDRYRDMADLEAALCEVQILLGLHTPWDDLEIPEFPDADRRARIVRDMPGPTPFGRHPRNLLWPLVAATSTLAAALLGAYLVIGRAPTDADRSIVDELASEARDAAARADWVVPPPDRPQATTALAKVLELERVEGLAAPLADARGADLRSEFSATLTRTADNLWDSGAAEIARDYYLWAFVFDDTSTHAFERSGASMGMVANFRRRAQAGEFSEVDRVLGLVARAEAEADPQVKQAMLADASAAAQAMPLSPAGEIVLAEAHARASAVRPRRSPPTPTPADESPAQGPPKIDPVAPPAARDSVRPTARGSRSRPPIEDALLGKGSRDPLSASQLAAEGAEALRAGRRSEAAALFNQAIAHDRRNALALMGLSDVYFDTGESQKAVEYAERAVAAAPTHQTYCLKLGDAYFKVLRYHDALEQYQRAGQLGSTRAPARITKVKAKLGN